MKFEFDPKKATVNKTKHGLTLEEATKLWDVLSVEIKAKTVDEERFMIIGKLKGRCYSCIYTMKGHSIRLISARRSRESEENIYNAHIKT
jgi:uncharacterized DUF497 family protein